MKYILLVGDGMADYPLKELNERTPLEAARTPNLDFIAQQGKLGRVKTIPDKAAPGSDVANISILGYDPLQYYNGRGPLEAANLGVELEPGDVAFRCNLVTVSNEKMIDYSAGHITSHESAQIMELLNQRLGAANIRFYPGVSYRNLLVIKNGTTDNLENIKCRPPHDIMDEPILRNLPKGKSAQIIVNLMQEARKILASHEINSVRVDLKENPANMIWLWGQGTKPQMPLFKQKYGLTGSVISAVDLIKGLGKILGLDVIDVPGATGYYDTDYAAKARLALNSLQKKDFVFVHVEAPDEAGHNGDLREKILAIERFDLLIVGEMLKAFKNNRDFRILALPDHATPVSLRTHTSDPVLFGMYGAGIEASGSLAFCEKEAAKSPLFFEKGHELMERFVKS